MDCRLALAQVMGTVVRTKIDVLLAISLPRAVHQSNSFACFSTGIQLSATNTYHPNRLIFAGHHGAYQYDCVWYSDDNGKTFQLSKDASGKPLQITGQDEIALVIRPCTARARFVACFVARIIASKQICSSPLVLVIGVWY